MKILILHRDSRMLGGVEKYYLKIKDKFREDVEFFSVGRRPGETGQFATMLRMLKDYIRFAATLRRNNYDVVHINPSIEPKSFVREGIFHVIARLMRQRTLIFFRGWHTSFQAKLEANRLWLFRLLYGKATAYIVLAGEFKKLITAWGATGPIYREVAIADDDELRDFNIDTALAERQASGKFRIIFAARVTAHKGIYELLEAVAILNQKHSHIELVVAGDSDEMEDIQTFTRQLELQNVTFAGYVNGADKDKLFKTADIFCMPTYYEGFPNVVVEAMAVGLPVVTRAVGGLLDFFENGRHGFMTTSKEPAVFADFIEQFIAKPQLLNDMSYNNYQYAQDNFLASKAAARLENIYAEMISGVSTADKADSREDAPATINR